MLSDKQIKRGGFIINFLYFSIIIGLIAAVFIFGFKFIWPFFFAFFFAFCLDPIVRTLTNKVHLPRKIASLITILLSIFVIGGLISLIVYKLISEATALATSDFINSIGKNLTQWGNSISKYFDNLPPDVISSMQKGYNSFIDFLVEIPTKYAGSILAWSAAFAKKIPAGVLGTVIMIISTYFISADFGIIKRFLKLQMSDRIRGLFSDTKKQFVNVIFNYIKSYSAILFITFVELLIGFTILDADYAITLAIVIAIMDILPILGTGTAIIPWAIYSFVVKDFKTAIGLLILYAIITIIRQYIEPKIVGKNVGLPPIVTIAGMYIGLRALGFLGMFIVPISLIIIKNLNDEGKIHIWKNVPQAEKKHVPIFKRLSRHNTDEKDGEDDNEPKSNDNKDEK